MQEETIISWRQIFGLLLTVMAIALWFLPEGEFSRLETHDLSERYFQLLAFPKVRCGDVQCPRRAVNFSLSEWNSGTLNIVHDGKDVQLPANVFTLIPPPDAREMIQRWRSELPHQGFDNGDIQTEARAGGGWKMELRLQDDVHSRVSYFVYAVNAGGSVGPERYAEYSWVDRLIRFGAIAIILALGIVLLIFRRAQSA